MSVIRKAQGFVASATVQQRKPDLTCPVSLVRVASKPQKSGRLSLQYDRTPYRGGRKPKLYGFYSEKASKPGPAIVVPIK